ncbi:N-acyl homoserine lactonase family protein [Rhodococcus sp. NPDC057529]|uniref:N-acyl homoserine lactonase family protein n=1 Tax=Rhodococcus sp. NPDC057529 TaxID=3346158 RepID=UPI00366B636D
MALRIQALHVGTMPDHPKTAVTFGRGHRETVDIAIIMFLITGGEHPVIVDTGTGTPAQTESLHGFPLIRTPEQEPLAALAAVGVDPADVKTVINTHLHWDHCSNNDLFPNARILVQEEELRYAVDPLPTNHWTYERRPGIEPCWMKGFDRIETVSGDVDLFPGIRLVHLPGHSPGSQGVVVEAENDRYLIAGDCITYHDNWDGDERLAHIPTGGLTNLHEFFDSFDKIEGLGCTVIPSHDPRVLEHGIFT